MATALRVLIVEDSEDDALLLVRALKRGGLDPAWRRVDDARELAAALDTAEWDCVLSDYTLPTLDAPTALSILKGRGLDVPFLIVSRNVGEDVAVAAMKAGAHDYIMKGNLARLVPAIEREIRDAHERETRRRAESALFESEERYALAARGANDGLWDWDLRTRLIYFSSRWKLMLGFADDEIGDGVEEWFSRVYREDAPRLKTQIVAHLNGETVHFENEHRMEHRDGSWRWMLSRGLAVRDEKGIAYRMAGSQTDITERKLAEEQLLHDAFHDALTGLPNRALFLDRLGLALERSRRRDGRFAVLFVDLDRFKMVNDGLGHVAGDSLLVAVSQRLLAFVHPGDTLARFGGDEFTILLDEVGGAEDAVRTAEGIQGELSRPFDLPAGREVFTTASVGIALSDGRYQTADELLRDADTAMYRAKAQGRARYVLFDAGMHTRAVELLTLETDLRRALERDELSVYYQPIVSIETGRLSGFEALVRWRHPQRGLVLPSEFIGFAEESGLVVPLGAWVLKEACRQTAAWLRAAGADPPLTVSVNVSARQLARPELGDEVEAALEESGLPASSLRLEITESLTVQGADAAPATLARLRGLGIELYVDDFGTGYSSLGTLQMLPVDKLKIDSSFVARLEANEGSRELVRTILALARNLGLGVIAEGVETEGQRRLLGALGCEQAQGFLFARPLTAEEAGAMVAARNLLGEVAGGA
ncbi:MAG TPA: EAL domain-containing protein [Thermoanaerobaculia bacterium]|nr:EAL domain-containing protein [Thermoanaerobaculia bacterium]